MGAAAPLQGALSLAANNVQRALPCTPLGVRAAPTVVKHKYASGLLSPGGLPAAFLYTVRDGGTLGKKMGASLM